MLSRREQWVLADIERRIRAEDPDIARKFESGLGRRRRRRWPYDAAVLAAFALLVLGLVLALPVTSFVAVVLSVAALGVRAWARRRDRAPDDGPPP
ncbi:Protein of unknown function (DUF3040) [Prauserella shujinwangii]|uniref:DUF3040 family protein n=1 Tax=Prauserella shujinwangii TaxID=1453103 RepID=A0A2T0LQW9_9PSEU|nr:DUF3040 domain-containing protein [Prauserella shujinwangii]PRX45901.1 Protein of unknown function (DUF3040) [Prauserella shujinwangii]